MSECCFVGIKTNDVPSRGQHEYGVRVGNSTVVNYNPSLLEPVGKAIAEFYGETVPAANTLIGVQSLALPEFLIEIEASAELG